MRNYGILLSKGVKIIGLFCLVVLTACNALPQQQVLPLIPAQPVAKVQVSATPALVRYAVFPAPPFMIGAGDEQAEMSGIDVDIVRELFRQMGQRVEFVRCTWERCLELMKQGDADILSSAYKKPEREEYMLYLEQPYLDHLPIAFYFLRTNGYVIDTYTDIYKFDQVGVLQGASYFEQFDQDSAVKKFKVSSQDQLFPMLLAGRLDVIAGYVPTENYRIAVGGYKNQVQRSNYEYQEQSLVYMTISKKSPLAGSLDQINRINQQLLDNGFIKQTIQTYYEKYR